MVKTYKLKIEYHIEKYENGLCTITGSTSGIEDDKGEPQNMLDFPNTDDLILYWMGRTRLGYYGSKKVGITTPREEKSKKGGE